MQVEGCGPFKPQGGRLQSTWEVLEKGGESGGRRRDRQGPGLLSCPLGIPADSRAPSGPCPTPPAALSCWGPSPDWQERRKVPRSSFFLPPRGLQVLVPNFTPRARCCRERRRRPRGSEPSRAGAWPAGGGDAGLQGGEAKSGGRGGSEPPASIYNLSRGTKSYRLSFWLWCWAAVSPLLRGGGTPRCLRTPPCAHCRAPSSPVNSLTLGDPSCVKSRKSHITVAFSGKLKAANTQGFVRGARGGAGWRGPVVTSEPGWRPCRLWGQDAPRGGSTSHDTV